MSFRYGWDITQHDANVLWEEHLLAIYLNLTVFFDAFLFIFFLFSSGSEKFECFDRLNYSRNELFETEKGVRSWWKRKIVSWRWKANFQESEFEKIIKIVENESFLWHDNLLLFCTRI